MLTFMCPCLLFERLNFKYKIRLFQHKFLLVFLLCHNMNMNFPEAAEFTAAASFL